MVLKFVNENTFLKLLNYNKRDLKYTYKIQNDHLTLCGMEKQNVRKVAEVLSNTISKTILHLIPEEKHVSEFIKCVNDGFDVLNSSQPLNII